MIEVNNLIKSYNGTVVLSIQDLHIEKGESFGLVGNNGAGKTTFFRAVLDLIRPDNGQVLSNGTNVMQNESWKNYTASYLDESFLIDYLSPEEYFEFLGDINGYSAGDTGEFLDSFKDFFNDEIIGKKKLIRELSMGNQKKVGLAAAFMAKPELLILDEPFANLDPSTLIRLKNKLKELRDNPAVTMMISSHDLNHVTEVCDRILVLDKGNIIHDIRTSENTLKELEEYFAI